MRYLCFLLCLLIAPARAGRFDLPAGVWTNEQRPGFRVVVGETAHRKMSWDADGLLLEGVYKVTAARGPLHLLFHIVSIKVDGQPVDRGTLGKIKLAQGQDVSAIWDWTHDGVRLSILDRTEQHPLSFELRKSK